MPRRASRTDHDSSRNSTAQSPRTVNDADQLDTVTVDQGSVEYEIVTVRENANALLPKSCRAALSGKIGQSPESRAQPIQAFRDRAVASPVR